MRPVEPGQPLAQGDPVAVDQLKENVCMVLFEEMDLDGALGRESCGNREHISELQRTMLANPMRYVSHLSTRRSTVADWAFSITVFVFATSTIAQPFVIPTPSMESTL